MIFSRGLHIFERAIANGGRMSTAWEVLRTYRAYAIGLVVSSLTKVILR
jgi:hypothetical protein